MAKSGGCPINPQFPIYNFQFTISNLLLLQPPPPPQPILSPSPSASTRQLFPAPYHFERRVSEPGSLGRRFLRSAFVSVRRRFPSQAPSDQKEVRIVKGEGLISPFTLHSSHFLWHPLHCPSQLPCPERSCLVIPRHGWLRRLKISEAWNSTSKGLAGSIVEANWSNSCVNQ
jgi:hypothetical protein